MWLIIHFLIITGLSVRVLLRPHRDPASRVAWILFIMALPYVGAVVYLMLGEVRPVHSTIRERLPNPTHPLIPAPANATAMAMAMAIAGADIPENASSGFSIGEAISGFAAVGSNTGDLLADSNATIAAIVADVDAAIDHVHLLFYIWLPDTNGSKVADAIVHAAQRGVTCRVVVDDLGSRDLIRSAHWSRMSSAGVLLARAQPIGNIPLRILRGRVDVRNHRKIVVIDNRITYCGSQNCADPEFAVKAKYAPWVDAVIRFEGPIAQQNQQLFLADWRNCTNEESPTLAAAHVPPQTALGFFAQVIGTGPENHYSAIPELFATLLFSARSELTITTPYYVPDDSIQSALCTSARRGIATTLILPARNDSWFVAAASRSYYAELLDAGVCIYEYSGGLLHTKTLTIDAEMTLIGSANLDRRSFELNYENNIFFSDTRLTQAICERQMSYIAKSKSVSRADVAAWSWRYRVRNNVMAILSPLL